MASQSFNKLLLVSFVIFETSYSITQTKYFYWKLDTKKQLKITPFVCLQKQLMHFTKGSYIVLAKPSKELKLRKTKKMYNLSLHKVPREKFLKKVDTYIFCKYIRYQYRFYLRSVEYKLNILFIIKFLKYCHFLEVVRIGNYRLNCKCVQNLGQITRPNKQINIFCLRYLLLIFCVLN